MVPFVWPHGWDRTACRARDIKFGGMPSAEARKAGRVKREIFERELSMRGEVENKSVWFWGSHLPEQRHSNEVRFGPASISDGGGGGESVEMGGSNVRRASTIKDLRARVVAHQ